MNVPARNNILIVEDETSLVNSLTEKLEGMGFSVFVARNGQEALDKIGQKKPDLILLDLILPVLDGISVLKQVKSAEETKGIPIVVLTNLSDDKKVDEVLKAGGSEYLVKANYSLDEVVAMVKRKLREV